MRTIIAVLLFACCLLVSSSAWAACPSTLQIKDNAGLTPTAKYTDDGAGNCMANVAIIDGGDITLGTKADIPFVGTGAASVVAILKGLYTTGGTTADAVYAGTGSATLDSILKGVYSSVSSSIPAGANVIGGVTATMANGADVTQGSTIDAPCVLPSSTSACTLTALLKAMANAVGGPTAAGTNVIGGVTIANGAAVPIGSTTDAPCTLPSSATPCSLIATTKAIANATSGGGGGGGAVTIANGAAVPIGSTTDPPCTLPATSTACTLEALAKAAANTTSPIGTTADAPCTLPSSATPCSLIATTKAAANAVAAALPAGANVIGGITIANGANVAQGSTTDVPCTLPSSATACSLVAIAKAGANAMAAALPAGSNVIGKVGIDQTTPGVTNNVVISGPPAAARHFPGCTVAATSGTCLAASTAVNFLQIQNAAASGGATMACAFGVAAVLNAASSFQLQPGQSAAWGPMTSGVPTGALNCIASAGSTPAYVEWN